MFCIHFDWDLKNVSLNCLIFHYLLPSVIFEIQHNRLGGVMVKVLALSTEGPRFHPWPGQTKDIKIGIYCFSAKHAALMSKSKDWSAQNQNNVSG